MAFCFVKWKSHISAVRWKTRDDGKALIITSYGSGKSGMWTAHHNQGSLSFNQQSFLTIPASCITCCSGNTVSRTVSTALTETGSGNARCSTEVCLQGWRTNPVRNTSVWPSTWQATSGVPMENRTTAGNNEVYLKKRYKNTSPYLHTWVCQIWTSLLEHCSRVRSLWPSSEHSSHTLHLLCRQNVLLEYVLFWKVRSPAPIRIL